MGKIKLYIVEDEMLIANDLKNRLTGLGYEVLGMEGRGEVAVTLIGAITAVDGQPDIVLMDITLAGKMDGIETAKILSEKHLTKPSRSNPMLMSSNRLTWTS